MGTLPSFIHHFRIAGDVWYRERIANIEGESQRPLEHGMFRSIAITAVNEVSIVMELTDLNLSMIGLQRTHGAHQSAAGTLFGSGLRHQQIRSGTVLPQEGGEHL